MVVTNRIKRRKKRFISKLILLLIVFMLGVWVGIHRKVIMAWIKGEELPDLPAGHIPVPFYKKLKK